jgi:hypothetical protein
MQIHRKNAMRPIIALFMSILSFSIYAADLPNPADLQALPPPALDTADSVDEPQVTIIKQTEQTVEEYRANGKLYMIKITPKTGKPYYMVDDLGDGKFSRHEGLDSGVRPPRWIIHRF